MSMNPQDLQRKLRGYTVNGRMFSRINKKLVELGQYKAGTFYPTEEAKSLMRSLMPDMALKTDKPKLASGAPAVTAPAPVQPRGRGRPRGTGGLPSGPTPPPHAPAPVAPSTDYVVGQGLQGVNPAEFERDEDDEV